MGRGQCLPEEDSQAEEVDILIEYVVVQSLIGVHVTIYEVN